MTEQYVQVPVSLIERVLLVGSVPTSLANDCRALLPPLCEFKSCSGGDTPWHHTLECFAAPPTPTAEPVQYNGHNGLAVFADAARRLNEGAPAAPPSIADMVPGTRLAYIIPAIEEWAGRVISDRMEPPLREGVKTWPAMKAQGYSSAIDEVIELVQHVIDGTYDLSRIDPSTIRDVTPPKDAS